MGHQSLADFGDGMGISGVSVMFSNCMKLNGMGALRDGVERVE